tara:strand:+ start:733 stop:1314 length:582 start_codon:yes stop_codon:yes gene_type:complete
MIMEFTPQSIPEIFIIKPKVHRDDRGYFVETFRHDLLYKVLGYRVDFIQDNEAKSSKGVLRGLHFQIAPKAQTKLVRVIEGTVLDVAVDIRVGSPNFGCHVAVQLSGENKKQMLIPRGFAHGYLVLSDTATVAYKVDNYYSSTCEHGLAFDDSELGIDWLFDRKELRISKKDLEHSKLSDARDLFEYDKHKRP